MDIIQKIRQEVHQHLDFSVYQNSMIRENTNSLSHVIGTTIPEPYLYNLGRISGKQTASINYYNSPEQVRELFVADLNTIDLQFEELALYSKQAICSFLDSKSLKENQHLAVLFIQDSRKNKKGVILGFHFLRYDPDIGWSSKKFNQYLCVGENVTWPSNWYDQLISCYKITR